MTASGLKSRPSVRTAARPRPAARALAAAPALAVPAALPRPPQAPARGTLEALLGLLAWWPLPLLLAAIVAVLAWQGWEMMRFRSMAVPGGIAVQTEGTRATITGGRVYVELPVLVSNSTDSPIREVALWARVYACPSAGAQVADCRLLLSAEQDLPLAVEPGRAAGTSSTMSADLPASAPGHYIRVERKLERVVNEEDAERVGPLDDDKAS